MISKKEKARRILDGMCLLCGVEAEHEHHPDPKFRDGYDVTIPLCVKCHARCHMLPAHTWIGHSEATKAGIEKKRATGWKPGINGKKLAVKNMLGADLWAFLMKPIISELQSGGYRTLEQQVNELNRRNFPTYTVWIKRRDDAIWHISSLHTVIKRMQMLYSLSEHKSRQLSLF